jgi:hypothetical protein
MFNYIGVLYVTGDDRVAGIFTLLTVCCERVYYTNGALAGKLKRLSRGVISLWYPRPERNIKRKASG